MKTKEVKRVEAEARQARYDTLSVVEKLALIEDRPGSSSKEHARILWS